MGNQCCGSSECQHDHESQKNNIQKNIIDGQQKQQEFLQRQSLQNKAETSKNVSRSESTDQVNKENPEEKKKEVVEVQQEENQNIENTEFQQGPGIKTPENEQEVIQEENQNVEDNEFQQPPGIQTPENEQDKSDLEISIKRKATEELQKIEKRHLSELKSFNTPPLIVSLIFGAVSCLEGVDEDWKHVKTILSHPDQFLNRLNNFDAQKVSLKTWKNLENKYLKNENWDAGSAEKSNVAANFLFNWVMNIYRYHSQNCFTESCKQLHSQIDSTRKSITKSPRKYATGSDRKSLYESQKNGQPLLQRSPHSKCNVNKD